MGRVSSIGVNQEINRPKGQLAHASEGSHFTTCGCLDFEVELAWVTGKGNDRGVRISVDRAEEHLFGYVYFFSSGLLHYTISLC
jgi:fumarylacetoacetase